MRLYVKVIVVRSVIICVCVFICGWSLIFGSSLGSVGWLYVVRLGGSFLIRVS